MSEGDLKSAALVLVSVMAKVTSLKDMRDHTGNLTRLPHENASRINNKIGSPAVSHAEHAGGSPNFLFDAAFSSGQQQVSPERVTHRKGNHIMTNETKKKVKPPFNMYTKDAAGKRQYVTSIYFRATGNGFQFKLDGKYYEIFPTKEETAKEEGA